MAPHNMKDKSAITYHHLSIPTQEKCSREIYAPDLRVSVVPGTHNAYGIEWARYDHDSDYPQLIKDVAHVAFEVENLAIALEDEEIIVQPHEIARGVRAAFIRVLNAPVELLEIDRSVVPGRMANPVQAGGKILQYHHAGLPSADTWADEIKVPELKLAYLPGKHNTYGVEWLRFEDGNQNPDIIKHTPHVAFEVPDLDRAIVGEKVIYHSGKADPGVIVAMIEVEGAPVELLQIDRSIVGDEYDR